MIAGRQILLLIDQHFRMSEMDGGVYDTEHLFSVKMKGEKLQEFITTWDQVLAGLAKGPDDATLQALLLRNLRQCKTTEQDIAHYDRDASITNWLTENHGIHGSQRKRRTLCGLQRYLDVVFCRGHCGNKCGFTSCFEQCCSRHVGDGSKRRCPAKE